MLQNVQGRVRLHMPGHKGRLPYVLPLSWDMTEIPFTDNLYTPESGILRAQEYIAEQAGARSSFILTGGATVGLIAMLNFAVRAGERVIIPRNAHNSALSACVFGGLTPEYIWPEVDETGYTAISVESMVSAAQNSKADAILVTRPDYYGMCCDLRPVVEAAKNRMAVLVDEAHGTHFNWWDMPKNAGRMGADMWVQSAHKTIPALTQGAVLHLSERYNPGRLKQVDSDTCIRNLLRRVQTSSPSFLVMASVEEAFFYMEKKGKHRLDCLRQRCNEWENRLLREGITSFHPERKLLSYEKDNTRLVADTRGLGISGFEVARRLRRRGFDIEMADFYRTVAITTVCDEFEWIERYAEALIGIISESKDEEMAQLPDFGLFIKQIFDELKKNTMMVMTPREAVMGESEIVSLQDGVGRVSAEAVGLYPPGVPLCCPGETITSALIEILLESAKYGATLFGLAGSNILVVKE